MLLRGISIRPKSQFTKFTLAFLFFVLSLGFLAWRVLLLEDDEPPSYKDKGLVVAVYDGDTIKVRFHNGTESKVRLIGIDTPETGDSREDVQFKAYMAKRFSFFYLYKRNVKLSYDQEREDKYGRILAYIWTKKEGLFNAFILREGFAVVFLKFPFKEDYKKEFIAAEREARKLKKGLWANGDYLSISVCDANHYIGRLISVHFFCTQIQSKGKYVFLYPAENGFSTLIPSKNLTLFPEIDSFKEQMLTVTGFLEEYKGEPQIVAFFPRQMRIEKQ